MHLIEINSTSLIPWSAVPRKLLSAVGQVESNAGEFEKISDL
ncbi:hypothetical protein J2129_001627 [Methanofollis sp. W23]|nr:hypothetical protein [Methanofollis sp. W23]MBP2146173.1 hypothetical protein [Methanofollis sp. W23]